MASRPLSSQSSLLTLRSAEKQFTSATSASSNPAVTGVTSTAEDAGMMIPQQSESKDGQISIFTAESEPPETLRTGQKLHAFTIDHDNATVSTKSQTDSIAAPSAGDLRNVLGPSVDKEPLSPAILPCRWLPTVERNNNIEYVGRTSYLEVVASALLPTQISEPKQTRVKAFAIIGTAGQGKTQTALQFAVRNQDAYQAILWARADKDHKILQDFAEFAVALGLLVKTTSNLWEDARALIRWFEAAGMCAVAHQTLNSG